MSDFRLLEDVQEQTPTFHVSLSRVGVTNVEKVIRIGANGTERLYWAKLDCFVDLRDRRLTLEQCFGLSAQPLDPSRDVPLSVPRLPGVLRSQYPSVTSERIRD